MRCTSAACTSPSLIVRVMATDRLAASLAATVQHDADQACLECVEREQHDDGENRDQVLFVAAGKRAGAGKSMASFLRSVRSPHTSWCSSHMCGMVQSRAYHRDQGGSGSIKM